MRRLVLVIFGSLLLLAAVGIIGGMALREWFSDLTEPGEPG